MGVKLLKVEAMRKGSYRDDSTLCKAGLFRHSSLPNPQLEIPTDNAIVACPNTSLQTLGLPQITSLQNLSGDEVRTVMVPLFVRSLSFFTSWMLSGLIPATVCHPNMKSVFQSFLGSSNPSW
jgi:hypothetical protein